MTSSAEQKPPPPRSRQIESANLHKDCPDISQEAVIEATIDGQPAAAGQTECPVLAETIAGETSLLRLETSAPVPPDWERYHVLGLLGKGGMGAVYKAVDRRLDRVVALKFIRGDDPHLTQRLLQEARAQARIAHENICKVHEVGEINGIAYIAMQFIDGQSLATAHRQMSLEDKVLTMTTVADAIHAAHRMGIIHREHNL